MQIKPYANQNFFISSEWIMAGSLKMDKTKKGETVYIVEILLGNIKMPFYFMKEKEANDFFNDKIKPAIK